MGNKDILFLHKHVKKSEVQKLGPVVNLSGNCLRRSHPKFEVAGVDGLDCNMPLEAFDWLGLL